jgi:hypothetical protein
LKFLICDQSLHRDLSNRLKKRAYCGKPILVRDITKLRIRLKKKKRKKKGKKSQKLKKSESNRFLSPLCFAFFNDRSLPSAKAITTNTRKRTNKLITVRFHAATALFPFFPVSTEHAIDLKAPSYSIFKQ